jgi:hypothetical protein
MSAIKKCARSAVISALALLGSGCAQNMPTLIETAKLCEAWTVYKPRKGDLLSAKSAAQLLANNEARIVYGCKRLENEAA